MDVFRVRMISFGIAVAAGVSVFAGCSSHSQSLAPGVPGSAQGAAALSQAQAVPERGTSDWPRWGYDGARTGHNPNENALNPHSVTGLKHHWRFKLAAPYANTQPIVAGKVQIKGGTAQVVYVGDEHGDLYAVNAATGEQVWKRVFGSEDEGCGDMPDQTFGNTSTPLYDATGGVLYLIATDPKEHQNDHTQDVRRIYALDPATGKGIAGWSNPVAYGDAYIHNTYSGLNMSADRSTIYFDRSSNCDINNYYGAIGSVNVSTQAVALGPDPNYGFITAAEENQGYFAAGVWSWGNPVVDPDSGSLFTGVGNSCKNDACDGYQQENSTYSDSVVQLSGSTLAATAAWQSTDLGGDVDFGTSPAAFDVHGSACIAASQKTGYFFSFNRNNLAAGPASQIYVGDSLSSPAFDAGTGLIYITADTSEGQTSGGTVIAFSVGAGCALTQAWQASNAQATYSSVPVVANGVVYVSGNYNIYALDASSGKTLWTSPKVPGLLVASPTVVNGCVYGVSWSANYNNAGNAYLISFCL